MYKNKCDRCNIVFDPIYKYCPFCGSELSSEKEDIILSNKADEDFFEFELLNNNTYKIIGLKEDTRENIAIPDTYKGIPITVIGEHAFFETKHLKHIVFGKNVVKVEPRAFYYSSIEKVEFNEGLVIIGEEKRYKDEFLNEMNYGPFEKSNVKTIVFPSTLEIIGVYSFFDTKIETLYLPKNIKKICESAFCRCQSLKQVHFSEGIEIIESGAFSVTSIKEIIIPNTVKEYGEGFNNCQTLQNVILCDGIESVSGFNDCLNLKRIFIPGSVNKFERCCSKTCTMSDGFRIKFPIKQIIFVAPRLSFAHRYARENGFQYEESNNGVTV